MAARFWVGGTGPWNGVSTANWSATTGGASGASAPTAADDVTIDPSSGSGIITQAAGAACNNLTITWTAVKTNQLVLSAAFAPAGAVSINGNSAINRVTIQSSVLGTARTLTIATLSSLSNVVFMDIAGAGAAAPFAGTIIGDAGGNSGITPTPAATQTATGTASFTWSTHGWTSRVPLPQDDVVINNAFIAGRTITADMPNLGKSVTFSCTGNPTITPSLAVSVFGSLTLALGMSWTGNQALTLGGRGSHTLQSNGVQLLISPLQIFAPGGTYTALDAPSVVSAAGLGVNHTMGTFDAATFNVSVQSGGSVGYRLNGGTVKMGTGTWTLGSTQSSWQYLAGTVLAQSSTIKFADSNASAKMFAGGNQTYNNFWFAPTGGTLTCQFTGSNTFASFRSDANCLLQFTAGTTQNIAAPNIAAGCTIGSITAASHTLNFTTNPGHVSVPNVTVSRSTVTPANWWFAEGSSTNGGNNAGWVFADYAGSAGAAADVATMTGALTTGMPLVSDPKFIVRADGRVFSVALARRDFRVASEGRDFTIRSR